MNQVETRPRTAHRGLVLRGMDWTAYSHLLRALENQPGIRVTSDRGAIEIMAPSLEHDRDEHYLSALVAVLAEELSLPLLPGGSVTLKNKKRKKGVEGDSVFWIANASAVRGVNKLNLKKHPAPDLAIEVEVSRRELKQLPIYAALGVPEVWRVKDDTLSIHVLGNDGKYTLSLVSRSFPIIGPVELMQFLQEARTVGDQIQVVRHFREWLRQKLAGGVN